MYALRRLCLAATLSLLVLAGTAGWGMGSHGTALAAGGNADAAHACQQGGYLTLQGSDGTLFKNEGQCVSYAAHGGTIVGINVCTVTSTTGCLTFNGLTLPSISIYGSGSITLTGATSFVDTCTSGPCPFDVPNDLATGGGTYTETNSSGAVISSGIYRIANTAGSYEGLSLLAYYDASGALVSSCSAATGSREVRLDATLIDSTTGALQNVQITTIISSLIYYPSSVEVDTPWNSYGGPVPSTTITC